MLRFEIEQIVVGLPKKENKETFEKLLMPYARTRE